MNKCVALFTGGKESVFSILKVRELGYEVEELIFLEKPRFSVHKVNIQAVKAVAQMLGHSLEVLKVNNEIPEDKSLTTYLERLKERGITTLVTGNVKIEENHNIYAELCEKVGLELVEPLYNRDTLELLIKYAEIGLDFLIIGIRKNSLSPEWLGKTITRENFEDFLAEALSNGIDPCGEYGEYHSLATRLSDLKIKLRFDFTVGEKSNQVSYLILKNPQAVKESKHE